MKEIYIRKNGNIAQIVLLENGNILEKYEENDKKKRRDTVGIDVCCIYDIYYL